jgi:hypothetical protein
MKLSSKNLFFALEGGKTLIFITTTGPLGLKSRVDQANILSWDVFTRCSVTTSISAAGA